MYVIRWQIRNDKGQYEWRYLGKFELNSCYELDPCIMVYPKGALHFPEPVAEWLCELLDSQYDLNPEMLHMEE